MRRLPVLGVLLLVSGLLLSACGDEAPPPQPTKEALVQTLRDLLAALEAGDNDAAIAHLVPLPDVPPDAVPDMLASFLKRGEISATGIDILASESTFGRLTKVLGRRGKDRAERLGLNASNCYALASDDAEVAAFWDGTAYRIFRLNDVGKQK